MIDADLRCCGVDDLDLEPGSVDLILTDPPYPAKYDPLLAPLAQLAERTLKPGGSAIMMVGTRQLPALFAAFAATDLDYRWTLTWRNDGARGTVWPVKMWAAWKPLVWFAKGQAVTPKRWMNDSLKGATSGKAQHEWQQDVNRFCELVVGFSGSRELVVDPFLGAGTTAVAASLHGRRFIGCDVDEACIRKTQARLDAYEEWRRRRGTVEKLAVPGV